MGVSQIKGIDIMQLIPILQCLVYLSIYLYVYSWGVPRSGCSGDFHDWIAINPHFAFEEDHNDMGFQQSLDLYFSIPHP